jgi:hypothetical protein
MGTVEGCTPKVLHRGRSQLEVNSRTLTPIVNILYRRVCTCCKTLDIVKQVVYVNVVNMLKRFDLLHAACVCNVVSYL